MPQLVVQDTLVSYEDSGKGTVLLCVHGWMHDSSSFKPLMEILKSDYRVISLDLPNFGNSQVNDSICRTEDFAEFIADFIAKLNIKAKALIGHSMGGQIIIKGTANGALNPGKLILISSAGIRDHRKAYKLFLKLASRIFRRITPNSLKNRFYSAIGSDYRAELSDIHKKIIKQTLGTDISSDAAKINLPTLLIYGSDDSSTPVWMGRKLHGLIKGSKFEIISGENHWPHQTAAEQTGKLIKDFLSVKE